MCRVYTYLASQPPLSGVCFLVGPIKNKPGPLADTAQVLGTILNLIARAAARAGNSVSCSDNH